MVEDPLSKLVEDTNKTMEKLSEVPDKFISDVNKFPEKVDRFIARGVEAHERTLEAIAPHKIIEDVPEAIRDDIDKFVETGQKNLESIAPHNVLPALFAATSPGAGMEKMEKLGTPDKLIKRIDEEARKSPGIFWTNVGDFASQLFDIITGPLT